jgi:hypothetical protein
LRYDYTTKYGLKTAIIILLLGLQITHLFGFTDSCSPYCTCYTKNNSKLKNKDVRIRRYISTPINYQATFLLAVHNFADVFIFEENRF